MNQFRGIALVCALLLTTFSFAGSARGFHDDGADGTPTASPMAEEHGMSGTGAAYMVIANAGGAEDRLVGGATEVAAVVEIHEIVDNAGVMEMRPLGDGLPVPAGGDVVLEPGGYHVMLIGLTTSLEPGMTFDLTLEFANAGEVAVPVTVQVRAPAADSADTLTNGDLTITGAFARPAPMIEAAGTPVATPIS